MSGRYKATDQMSELISDDYRMLQIITRFGIKLGFGEQTIETTCRQNHVHIPTFLAVVNFTKNAGHTHINETTEQISVPQLLQYLQNSHQFFVEFRLPNIRRKLIEAVNCSSHNQVGMLTLKFYDEYAQEVSRHMDFENNHVHPFVNELLAHKLPHTSLEELGKEHSGNHASMEKSIVELKNIIIKYSPNEGNDQLLNDALMDIYMTEEDLLLHCKLEDTLFTECVRKLEREVRMQSGNEAEATESDEEEQGGNVHDELSEREKEVISQVARGLSNKEIAEKMFISVNTVMTHRRNISRKLNVRSAAGLTIYAIVNGLVKLEEVEL